MDKSMESVLEKLKGIEHGFKHIIDAGEILLATKTLNHFEVAEQLWSGASYQERMLAVHLLGKFSANEPRALKILESRAATDINWRVQEMLAKAFDQYCADIGYEKSLPKIQAWLADPNPNVKRAVIEGLRIWTARPYFDQHPEKAIAMISQHKADESSYLRKSVGNSLRDISKKFPVLVSTEISTWDDTDKKIAFTKKLVLK